jgi:hypothetical protein
MRLMLRALASALGMGLLCSCAPLLGPKPLVVREGRAVFAGQQLCDGDVIVSRVHGPMSMLLARHSPTPGDFSHAGVFGYAANGTPMVYHLRDGGRRAVKAKRYLGPHGVTGIYRHRRPEAPDLMGQHLRQWLAENDIHRTPFDLFPDPDHFDEPPYNCNTFVNALYLGAGLDRPFEQPAPTPQTAWVKEISRFVKNDWTRLTSAGAVVHNPAFREVVVWHNPRIDQRLTVGLEALVDTIHSEVEAGRHFRPQAQRLPARLMAACCGRDDADYATPQVMAMHINLADAWARVSRRLTRLIRRDGDAFTEADARDLARKLALVHLEGFFE